MEYETHSVTHSKSTLDFTFSMENINGIFSITVELY